MRKLLILLAICFSSYTLMAQSPLNIGIHGGISSTKLKIKDLPGLKSEAKSGYMFGAFARVNLGPIYIEPSLNFNHKESEVKSDGVKEALKYNSFDIPVMIGLHFLDLSVVKLRAYLGPVASFTGKLKSKYIQEQIHNDKVMWNAKFGVGVDVWKVTFDIDYEKSLKKFQKDIKGPSAFNFTLGFKII